MNEAGVTQKAETDRSRDSACFILPPAYGLGFRFRFAEAGDFVAGFALAALLEEGRAFETLEYIALTAQSGGRAETGVL